MKAEKINPGIYSGVPFDEYQTWDAVNNSLLSKVQSRSALHAKCWQDNPEKDTPALLVGRAAHTQALEPDKFAERFIVAPLCDRRTTAGKAAWEAFMASVDGRDILTSEQYEQAKAAVASINGHIINHCIKAGEAEVCIVWQDKETGLMCKSRIDYVHKDRDFLIDLKTTEDASPEGFARSVMNYDYDQQAAFSVDGWQELTGNEAVFTFVALEKHPPYAVAAYEARLQEIEVGRAKYRPALNKWAECIKTNQYPSYSNTVEVLQLPDWYLKKWGVHQYRLM